ncbi:MAG: hypothetical protein IJ443_00465 [Firmicutes bacterium]|nr:hypothetical protein [Bacillota bacterium]
MLHIKLLGNMKIWTEEGTVSGVSEKGLALLALLFMEDSHQCRRYMLMDALWPDSTEDAAKYNLRYNLWTLKKHIPSDASGESLLVITRDYCGINERYRYECDFDRVKNGNAEDCSGLEELEGFLQLFTGDFFGDCYLEGCSAFQEQIIRWRFSLENKKLVLLRKLIPLYYEEQDWNRCMELLDICEEMDPYDEEHARIRMDIYIKKGEYETAARYYRQFSQKLAIDIGVEPAEELKKMEGTVRSLRREKQEMLELYTVALEHVPGYWMNDILRALLETEGFCIERYLESEQVADLAALQYRLGQNPVNACLTRTVDAFMELMGAVCSEGRTVRVLLEKNSRPDSMSLDVMHLLQAKCRKTLEVIMK